MASGDVDRLRDDQWERLRDLVPGGREGQRGPRCDNRLFVDALLWMVRSGARWRDLPECFGDHQAVKRRYYRWIARGPLGGFLAVPVRLLFGPGQRHDATRSHELIDGLKPEAVIADKGYDADHLHKAVRGAGAELVIPAKSNRKERRPH